VLVALPQVAETYEGTSIIKTDTEKNRDHVMSIIGLVVDMGADAYGDQSRFPDGPWCKQGDYVMFRMNSGTRFTLGGTEYRLMNDDSIEAVVADPRGIQRA
jgi:co-chaperonin GroES (HSP10)